MIHVLKAGIALVAFCALPMSPVAEAEPPARQVSIAVSYADLDLSSPAGAEAMLGRLRLATRKICGDAPHPSQLSVGVRQKSCKRSVMTNAVETLGHPTVTAAYSGRRGAQTPRAGRIGAMSACALCSPRDAQAEEVQQGSTTGSSVRPFSGDRHATHRHPAHQGRFHSRSEEDDDRKVTDAMVSVQDEAMRGVTWVRVQEIESGDWAIGGQPLTTADVKKLAAAGR